ncbi:hypothetical protein KEM56_004039 [Ascosphaera pollenicola]|nr:hypothetical protein KEM56_004039 [Ascosphaera pollenicola]
MAVQDSGKCAISWQHKHTKNEECVALYTESHTSGGDPDSQEREADESILINSNDISDRRRPPGPVTYLSFNDYGTQLLYRQATSPIYECYQKLNSHDLRPSRVFRNYSNAVWRQGAFVTSEVLIGTPFFCTHSQSQTAQGSFCHWTYLALGTVTNHSAQSKEAYLVRSEAVCRSNNCTHRPNLDRGRRLSDWVSVADLRNYGTLMGSTTKGTISYAISGRRIAIASENKICIWSLIPDAVIQGTTEYGGIYRDFNLQDRYLHLEPDT